MLIPGLVLAICSATILVGAAAELAEALQARRSPAPVGSAAVQERVLTELDPRPVFAWTGLAAAAVLAPAFFRGVSHDLGEIALLVVVLGFAAERGSYLVGRAGSQSVRTGGRAMVVVVTVILGVVATLGS